MQVGASESGGGSAPASPVWRLDGRGGMRRLDASALVRGRPEGPRWIDLDERDPQDRAWLLSASGLGHDDGARFLAESAWPKVNVRGPTHVLLLMRVPNPAPASAADALVLFRIWLEPERVISMCVQGLRELEEARARLFAGRGPASPWELLLTWMELMETRVADEVLELRAALADLEDVVEEEGRLPSEELRRLRRRVVRYQRFVEPQRDLLLRLRSLELPSSSPPLAERWRAVLDFFGEATAELESIAAHIGALQQATAHRTGEQMNRRIYALTLVSTLLLPPTLITSLLGANVSTEWGNILGMRHPAWFLGLCFALLALCAIGYGLLRRQRLL